MFQDEVNDRVWIWTSKILFGLLVSGLIGVFAVPRVNAAAGCFPDTTGHWSETFVCFLADNGIVGGYSDGTYRPGNKVTRAELSVFIKRVYDLAETNDDDTLAGLGCSTDQVAKWNGSSWVCAADQTDSGSGSSPLDDLSCASGEVVQWGGGSWVCKDLKEDFYMEAEVDSLLAAKVTRIQELENKLASVSLENGGNDFVFEGVNLHVRDGTGDTDGTTNGLGNVIVDYNEDSGNDADHSGSHNLVVGTEHSYSSYGGLVVGYGNTISGPNSTVTGGTNNTASGSYSSISGGSANTASGNSASVSGGLLNTASGLSASVIGGENNQASGESAAVLGGGGPNASDGNEAWANYSVVGGGRENVAGDNSGTDRTVGIASMVLSGIGNDATGTLSTVSGGQFNEASGSRASVSGGNGNAARAASALRSAGVSTMKPAAESHPSTVGGTTLPAVITALYWGAEVPPPATAMKPMGRTVLLQAAGKILLVGRPAWSAADIPALC